QRHKLRHGGGEIAVFEREQVMTAKMAAALAIFASCVFIGAAGAQDPGRKSRSLPMAAIFTPEGACNQSLGSSSHRRAASGAITGRSGTSPATFGRQCEILPQCRCVSSSTDHTTGH